MKYRMLLALLVLLAGMARAETAAPAWNGVGIDEKLGGYLPLDARFVREDGAEVSLGDLIRTPTLLSFVYYHCPNACDFLITGIAHGVRALNAVPGTEYAIITISIDENEKPEDAVTMKRIGLETMEKPFPPEAWTFLTGDAANIRRVAEATGFRFQKNGNDFDHPLGLVVLSPKGKIVRYMNGTEFLPVDLKMSILEASAGTVRPTIAKVLRFCFAYDPSRHQYIFASLKVSAILVVLLAAGLVLYLVISGKKRHAKGKAA